MKTAARKSSAKPTGKYSQQPFVSREERIKRGKELREKVPRESHATWKISKKKRDPVLILEDSNRGRIPNLVPIRYGRMLRSVFTFLRGSASLMAYDLSTTPDIGVHVQACGDCHLLNFGLFATPERNLVFDINDFDETLPAPWEWDVKRLAVSVAVTARDNALSDSQVVEAVLTCVSSYRTNILAYSKMNPLAVWYDRLDDESLIAMSPNEKTRKRREQIAERARTRIAEHLFPSISHEVGGHHRIVDQPPLITHSVDESVVDAAIKDYRRSLSDDRRVLFDRYRLEDIATKVVGIGSVGTRCVVGLFLSPEKHPLLLQFKEALHSVLEPYAGKSVYKNQGQRVVVGQRLMQSSSDIFLGWTHTINGRNFYARQLRDMKLSVPLEGLDLTRLKLYVEICAWSLARAHAKSGDAATISGYIGKSDIFDKAIADFAIAYADQTENDYRALIAAEVKGSITALFEEDL